MRKSCNVHMAVFEFVVHRNVDNWIQSLALCISRDSGDERFDVNIMLNEDSQ